MTQQPGVNLSKVTLSKATPSINLTKPGEHQGVMRVNLNWSRPRGFFRRGKSVDLDLGCLYELANGAKGVVQATGGNFGSLAGEPYIQLDGDDRSGDASGGENMHIDLSRPERFRRVLIFAFIYEGVPNWAAADGVVTLYPTSGPQVEVRLDSPVDGARSCAIALLQNHGNGITVQREVQYINGSQRFIDQAYGWGMEWHSASK
ncbi:Tellurium resistance [Nocardia puris]|uniref:Tellurite resistance protein TerA n=1 Tax=Nocardia puris TaxID=208602 RepID=A0A366DN87_9NOCA|nr:Tellurium resistance [Nocardia puris]MBF6213559.1 Tellurium resistance [Nocardia puris]MBF6365511.1 Tellurium resistance [Nocardia puris]MBF6459977.1 Tellurium resistance [Nocardia puris]RBO91541.1 tellurite resistance protein TerA [Nocardia puris]